MTTFTWVANNTGDWNSTANWTSGSLPDSTATVLIPDGSSAFVSKVGATDNEIINALTIGDVTGTAPTLEVAGTLQIGGIGPTIFFADGTIVVDSTGVFEGAATSGRFLSPFGVTFINNGTVRADGGSGTALQVLTSLTNNGTLLADNGILAIGGQTITNLSGNTLTGGSYIVEGPASGTFNEIEIGGAGQFNAVIGSDAATIVLDGGATEITGFSGGSVQTIEQQLTTIVGGSGTLEVLGSRGYTTTNALTDNGLLIFQGGTFSSGTLTIGGSGSFDGFGIVNSTVVDQGALIASGGALDLAGGGNLPGSLTTMPGATLILTGGSPSSVTNNGVIYDASGLLTISNLSGSGTLVVQNGGTLALSAATPQEIVFSGSNVTVDLTNPSGYTGTLSGFGIGDTLIITGTADTATVVNGNTLAVLSSGSTIDTFLLAGSYTGATFSVTQSGTNAVIQNTGGAPARQDFQFSVSLNDTDGLSTAEETQIVNDLSAAAADWAQYVTGHAPLRILLNISPSSGSTSELATGGFTASTPSGEIIGSQTIFEPSSIYALTTGSYISGTTADIVVNLPLSSGEIGSSLYVNPNPFVSGGTVPSGQFDLLTVFRHEVAHGLGFDGFTDPNTGAQGADLTLFDHFIQETTNAGGTITAANFIGPDAEAAYGAFLGTNVSTPVPLTLLNNGEAFFHVANSSTDPLGKDLMSGVGLNAGTSRDISTVDLAMLQDAGLPVTAPIVCYARGTRIATPGGEVAIERLAVGDRVLTAAGRHAPIMWIGRRRVDCRRHPHPGQVRPVRIRAGAFAPDLPRRDLLVSPQHALYAEGVLIPARCLVNGRSVAQIDVPAIEYFHIELDQHDLLLAEGLAAESYLDCGDRGRFENADGPLVLHPDFLSMTWEGSGCAELRLSGPEVTAVLRQLAVRADAMAAAEAAAA